MQEFLSSVPVMLALGNVVTVITYRFMMDTFYDRKEFFQKRKEIVALVFLLDFVVMTGVNLVGIPFLNAVSMFLTFLIPMYILYRVNNLRGLLYFFFYVVISVLMELVLVVASGTISQLAGFTTDYEDLTPLMMVLLNVSQIIAVILLCRFGNKDKDKRYDRVTLLFLVTPLFTFFILVADMIMFSVGAANDINYGQFFRLLIILLFTNIMIFIILELYTSLYKKELNVTYEKLKAEADAQYMEVATDAMKRRLESAESMVAADRMMRHDRRHFEAMLFMLLEEGKVEEAKEALQERLAVEPRSEQKFCENNTCNAAIAGYVKQAENAKIKIHVAANIPEELNVDSLELAIAISNLLENAIHACEKLPEEAREIKFFAKYKGQLLIEVENACEGVVPLDENGHPQTFEEGHGVGTKSVVSFVEKFDGAIKYISEEGRFRVHLLL